MSGPTYVLAAAVTATGIPTGSPIQIGSKGKQMVVEAQGATSASTGAATIKVYGSRDNQTTAGVLLGTITLTLGTTVTRDGFAVEAPWEFYWVDVSALSGTGANVTVKVGT